MAIVNDIMIHEIKESGQHEKGVKLDQGKPRIGLVLSGFPRALESVSAIGTFGANKYTDNGWQSVENGFNRYTDAMMRHWMAYNRGEINDPESQLPHLAHFAWNALSTLELKIREQE
jgi:hypothetical protein